MSRHYNHMKTSLTVAGIPVVVDKVEYKGGVVKFAANVSENSTSFLVANLGQTVPFKLDYAGNNCDALKMLFAALSVSKPEGVLKLDIFGLEESDDCRVVFAIE